MKKYEFMYLLDKALGNLPEAEKSDIINDYEEHFRIGSENGKTDAEICESLGDPAELAKSYLDGSEQPEETEMPENTDDTAATVGQLPAVPVNSCSQDSGAQQAQSVPYTNTQAQTVNDKTFGIIAIVLLIVFVFIPAGSAILGILIGMAFGAVGCVIGGIAVICGSFLAIANSALLVAGMITGGIALIALGILLGFGTYYACKGCYKLILMIIDFCKGLVK